MKVSKKRWIIFVLCTLMQVPIGCGSIYNLDDAVANAERRRELLSKSLTAFNSDVQWGDFRAASQLVAPQAKQEFENLARQRKQKEKGVDFEVENISENNNGFQAEVDVRMRYFRIPHYVVESRVERQYWEFERFQGGWMYYGARTIKSDNEEQGGPEILGRPQVKG